MARCVVPVVAAYATVALMFFLLLSLPPRRQHRPHRRLKLRTAAIARTPGDRHRIPFDPIISEMEIIRDDREWERNHFVSIGGAPPAEPQPEWEKFTDAEDYINDEDKFNVTDRIKILFPKIDVSPQDGFITHEELTEWNFKQAENEVLHRTRRDIELRDKDHDGCISFQEYEPPNWVRRTHDYNLTDEKVGWWKEEHFNASDMDGNGCLNLTEFNDFLHPADTNNPKLIEWLCREEIRERDKDDDGRLNYHEYLTSLFRLIRNYDEFSSSTHGAGSSSETQAKQLFAQLDLDHDGFLSANELKPIINDLHPSERFFAKQQADYVISQADTDKDGRLSLKEMIDNPYVFYSVIFSEENDYIYHDEFR
ncbi:reticulocalbin-2-like [Zingiber officinale]|uniref:EF-hand domain-containing protein n=1 Tax=Zingiber officinale TaxID=94328 RepID=A0A8J5BEE5_ZINOF|nr:reticulocalbin-2-like [Zingiber officinale]XP_042447188.1 reticulocalbin-2-like [Zingiber officinale]KAG6470486.1 hypothetical protein ZIOFF_071559 [Zingiber officinale]